MKLRLPESARNWISLTGAMIAIISFFMILFLFVLVLILDQESSYVGLVIYIILPAFLIFGLILIPIGMLSYRKKIKERGEDWPKVDLNDVKHRNAFFIFVVGTTIFLFLSAIGSYQAFHYTESVEFCGTTCHNIMIPEYTAYQNSPHARVACVDCHVGSGANWYMRSKLSGLYQVYATMVDNYPRPIPTPIKNLRPARDTCEKCHWPEKFYPQSLRVERHYLNNDENTAWDIYLNIKTGGTFAELGLDEGIHWHINPNVEISYISGDEKNLTIPWVKYNNKKKR
jgi:amino acid transporter